MKSLILGRRGFLRQAAAVALCCVGAGGLHGCAQGGSSNVGSTTGGGAASGGGGASGSSETLTREIFAFDTEVSLRAVCSEDLMDAVVARCYFFENTLSRTVEGSDVWRINAAGGAPTEVSTETAECIERSLRYSEMTDGLFDITIGAVSSLWDFVEGIRPADEDIAAAVRHVGYQGVSVDGTTVTLADPEAKIDLGGIAKGYIADDLHRMFVDGGCESGYVNIGGNVMLIGSKEDGSDWNVGVRDPNEARGTTLATVRVSDRSVVTSGLYEREFEQDGVTYYHILDPQTGYPAQTDLVSSSILSDASVDGDALATALFIMGRDRALDFVNGLEGIDALLVDDAGAVAMSDGAPFELA